MNTSTHADIHRKSVELPRYKIFMALSRTPHGVIDMATPCFAALVWLGEFPPFWVTLLGLVTAFAGYTAVYALNDVVDYANDQKKMAFGVPESSVRDIDGVWIRHPLAQGFIPFKNGVYWVLAWASVAIIGAWILNPVCLMIFLAGCILETLYCRMLKITHYRVLVSGTVKTLGAVAAIFAVDPSPSPGFVAILFLFLYFWEIGGQNIPNDWSDIHEDKQIGARTVPVQLGIQRSAILILGCILMALLLNVWVFKFSRAVYEPVYLAAALATGIYLLLIPAIRLMMSQSDENAMRLFNRGSHYPVVLLAIVLIRIILGG
ncbi:MAG: UbiA family prenyltransferase [Desulfatirhabdiaceae bacterium]